MFGRTLVRMRHAVTRVHGPRAPTADHPTDHGVASFASAALRAHAPGDVLVALAAAAAAATQSEAAVIFTVRDDGLLAPVAAYGHIDPDSVTRPADLGMTSSASTDVVSSTLAHGALTSQGFAAAAGVAVLATGAAPRVLTVLRATAYDGRTLEPLRLLAELAGTALTRLHAETALRESEQRLSVAQAIAHMGSYDWDIKTDTNVWSDELYRIYGYEPQSFNASYERFLSLVHPDDREQVIATHQQAYARGGTYSMRERIVRPDGAVRILLTTGEVVTGADGTPARMRGICWDVTDREAAVETAQRSVAQVTEVADASPTPCVIVDDAGIILAVNATAVERFGWLPSTTIGRSVTTVVDGSGLPDTVGLPVVATVRTRTSSRTAEVRSVAIDAGERHLVVVYIGDEPVPPGVPEVPRQSGVGVPRPAGA